MLANFYSSSSLAAFAYDSILTFAMLLNRTVTVIENGNVDDFECRNKNGTGVHLEEFEYENDLMGCLFLNVLKNLSFDGISV